MRWLAPTSAILCSRRSSELGCRLSERTLQQIVRLAQASTGSRSAPACCLSGDTQSPSLLLLRSFIRSAPVLRFLALSLPLICAPRAGGRGWLRPRPSLSLAHGATGLGMLCVVAATTVSTSGLTVVGTVVLMQRTCRPRLTSFSSALTVRSLGCLQLLPHLSVQLHPGAGHGVAQPPVLSNRRIKRWLYRFLQRRSDPVTVSAALAACDGAFGSRPGLSVGFRLCIKNLRREGGMVLTVVAGEPAIALA